MKRVESFVGRFGKMFGATEVLCVWWEWDIFHGGGSYIPPFLLTSYADGSVTPMNQCKTGTWFAL